MRLKLLAATAALAVSAALPALAQYNYSADINAAYERGATSGATPLTRNELVRCAAYWYVWDDFHDEMYNEATLTGLNPALTGAQVSVAMQYWEAEASDAFEGLKDGEAQFMAAAEKYIEEAWEEGEGIAYGESYLYAEILGACALPPEED